MTTGVDGELAISLCGIHTTGAVTGWLSKRPGTSGPVSGSRKVVNML